MLYPTTWAALRRPDINREHVPKAVRQAKEELDMLKWLLDEIGDNDRLSPGIKADISVIEDLLAGVEDA